MEELTYPELDIDINACKTAEEIFAENPSTCEIPDYEPGFWAGKLEKPKQDGFEYIPDVILEEAPPDNLRSADSSWVISEKELGDGESCCIGL